MSPLTRIAVGCCVALLAAGSAAAQEPTTPAQQPTTLDELLREVRRGSAESRAVNEKREAEFRARKAEQQKLLRDAEAVRAREERRSEQLEAAFGENEIAIANLEERLRNRLGSLGELFGVVRQVAGDTRGHLESSLVSAEYPGRAERMDLLAQSKKLPRIPALEDLWFNLQQEMTESGKVVRFTSSVVLPDGDQAEREVVRVGVFNAVSEGKFLRYLADTGKLQQLPRQPPRRHTSAAKDLEEATDGLVTMSIDPSRGAILGLLVETPTFYERLEQGGVVGVIIIVIGFIGLILVAYRFVSLTLVGGSMQAQLKSDRADERNPLGRLMAVYEANRDADAETVELRIDESILKDTPRLERGLATVRVLYVIAPLLGLLGTVTGMIETFQMITLFGTGDPKLMAGGISEALVTTMLGLTVAIPLVLLHSILRDRSRGLVQILEEQGAGMVAERSEREAVA